MTRSADEVILASRLRVAERLPVSPVNDGLDQPTLSIVIPLYNEQESLSELYQRLSNVLRGIGLSYELIFVNDGSHDATAMLIDSYALSDPAIVGLHLSRNFGHQSAVSAGLDQARGRAVIVLDGDLQDPPELIPKFVAQWQAGADVVYAIRVRRPEGWLRKLAYWTYYRVLRIVSDHPIPVDAGDFCLMDRRVVDVMTRISEKIRFVRGLRAFVGFRQVGVEYARSQRSAGYSKYSLGKLLKLAADGVFGFGLLPVMFLTATSVTLFITLISFVFTYILRVDTMTLGSHLGLLVVLILMIAISHTLGLAIIAEYARRIHREVTGRPNYIITRRIHKSIASH